MCQKKLNLWDFASNLKSLKEDVAKAVTTHSPMFVLNSKNLLLNSIFQQKKISIVYMGPSPCMLVTQLHIQIFLDNQGAMMSGKADVL